MGNKSFGSHCGLRHIPAVLTGHDGVGTTLKSDLPHKDHAYQSNMTPDKKRLYIALYPSGVTSNEERKYHWAFLIGPKDESASSVPGTRIHVKNTPLGWTYETQAEGDVRKNIQLLARILIAKIEDEGRLLVVLKALPVVQSDPGWRCRSWIATALEELAKDGVCLGRGVLDWKRIERFAREYVGGKTEKGRYSSEEGVQGSKPTWDMIEGKEVIA